MATFFNGENVLEWRGAAACNSSVCRKWDKAIFTTVDQENWTTDLFDELVGANLIAEQPADREDKAVAFDLMEKTIVGGIEN